MTATAVRGWMADIDRSPCRCLVNSCVASARPACPFSGERAHFNCARNLISLSALEADRHADMAFSKSKPFIKSLCVGARLVGQKFDQPAASGARLADSPLHELFADAATAAIGGDA